MTREEETYSWTPSRTPAENANKLKQEYPFASEMSSFFVGFYYSSVISVKDLAVARTDNM